jgi:hypothetical protein
MSTSPLSFNIVLEFLEQYAGERNKRDTNNKRRIEIIPIY